METKKVIMSFERNDTKLFAYNVAKLWNAFKNATCSAMGIGR